MHWGLYAIPAWHEQIQRRRNISRREYEKLIYKFNPSSFDPDRWLDLAEEAGMEYICFTTKHHDGFCMWDTGQTDFNIMNSPFKKDILYMLAAACRKRKFPLCLYYSVADWHHPNYPNQGKSHELDGPEEGDEPDLAKYLDFLKAQVRELCTQYGEIHGFWWDMNHTGQRLPCVNMMIRDLQPKAVINNRGFDEGDYGTPEREKNISRACAAPFTRPAEACNSVGTQSWGYKSDEDYYSLRHIIQSIDGVLARGGNYLLNVGPAEDGTMPPGAVQILKAAGRWYRSVKEAYSAELVSGPAGGSETCPGLQLQKGMLVTERGRTVYIHLNSYPESEAVLLKPLASMPEKAVLLNTGEDAECRVDLQPSFWRGGKKYLRIRNLPVDRLANQVLIIKLSF